jgi:predicted DNA-binding transcriptional regulator AlpA
MRFISKKQVCQKLAIARATLDRRRRCLDFPKPHKAEGKRGARCYWLEHEIEAWMQKRPVG